MTKYQELTNAVVTEVMGGKEDPDWCYSSSDESRILHWDRTGWVVIEIHSEAPSTQKPFDPLHDHNHCALARDKMRERGYWRVAADLREPVRTRVTFYTQWGITVGEDTDTDELRAECEAMVQAVRAEK